MNGDKIFFGFGNIENVATRSRKTSLTNKTDVHTCATCGVNLISPLILVPD
jgi:hypothetical protein